MNNEVLLVTPNVDFDLKNLAQRYWKFIQESQKTSTKTQFLEYKCINANL